MGVSVAVWPEIDSVRTCFLLCRQTSRRVRLPNRVHNAIALTGVSRENPGIAGPIGSIREDPCSSVAQFFATLGSPLSDAVGPSGTRPASHSSAPPRAKMNGPSQIIQNSGIETDQGILVNRHLQTSIPDIYAAGDVAQGLDFSTGEYSVQAIQPTATDHGYLAACNMCGATDAIHQ